MLCGNCKEELELKTILTDEGYEIEYSICRGCGRFEVEEQTTEGDIDDS